MEGHHGSIWLRPAARSTGKIVSICPSEVSGMLIGKPSYQKLYFRNLNHPIGRASVVSRRQESRTMAASMNRSLGEQARDDRRLLIRCVIEDAAKFPAQQIAHL